MSVAPPLIVDAEFEVIEPATLAPQTTESGPHPLTETVCYWAAALICGGLAIWARPYGMHLIDQVLFHHR